MELNELHFDIKRFKDYSTFMPLLLRILNATDGPVLELGGGFFSTPFLHWVCKEQDRKLVTYETNEAYFELCRKYRSKEHSIRKVDDWDNLKVKGNWSVALIDHDGFRDGKRASSAWYLQDKVDFIVLHDTERPEVYKYDEIFPKFKYRYTYKNCRPWSTVVSNLKRIPEWVSR